MNLANRQVGVFRSAVLGAMVLVLLGATVARAEFIGAMVTVTATSAEGSAFINILVPPIPDGAPDRVQWELDRPQELRTNGEDSTLVATIESLLVTLDGDPAVDLSFAVTAGNQLTTFHILSALVTFSPLVDPPAYASAGITLTDGAPWPGDGATVAPVPPNTGIFRAMYNGDQIFAEIIDKQQIFTRGTIVGYADTGLQTIPGPVWSIQTEYVFTLTAKDHASGTSRFEVIPEPSTWTMLASLGAVALAFLRRRRTI
jgi:hypothetical protein